MLEALGWDVRDPDEVFREFKAKSVDSPVDYALTILRKPRLFVEAKGLGETLTNRKWVLRSCPTQQLPEWNGAYSATATSIVSTMLMLRSTFAEVKPPQSTFFFRFCSPFPGVPSTCRSHLRVARLAAGGEPGNPEVIVPCIPRHLSVLMRPPGLFSGFRAFGLVASSGVRPHRVGTTFYPS